MRTPPLRERAPGAKRAGGGGHTKEATP